MPTDNHAKVHGKPASQKEIRAVINNLKISRVTTCEK